MTQCAPLSWGSRGKGRLRTGGTHSQASGPGPGACGGVECCPETASRPREVQQRRLMALTLTPLRRRSDRPTARSAERSRGRMQRKSPLADVVIRAVRRERFRCCRWSDSPGLGPGAWLQRTSPRSWPGPRRRSRRGDGAEGRREYSTDAADRPSSSGLASSGGGITLDAFRRVGLLLLIKGVLRV